MVLLVTIFKNFTHIIIDIIDYGVVLDVSDALVFTTEITERSEIECQCCVGLKLELNKIAMELESTSSYRNFEGRAEHCGCVV
jgi:acetate kinase